jgi:hypothetical protein
LLDARIHELARATAARRDLPVGGIARDHAVVK